MMKGITCNTVPPDWRPLNVLRPIKSNRHLTSDVYKDRLLRFGSEIVFRICKAMGTEVVILQQEEKIDPQQRFCQDLVEIMTVFCSKIYGQRSHANRKARQAAQKLANDQV